MPSSLLTTTAHEASLSLQDEPLYEIVDGQRLDLQPTALNIVMWR